MRSFLCWLVLTTTCLAQIEAPEAINEYTIGTATCITPKPTDGRIRYLWSSDDSSVCLVPSVTAKLLYFTAPKGTHSIKLIVATCAPDALDLNEYVHTFTVGSPSPGPVPDPVPDPVPTPDPVDIADLFDAATRATLAEFYRDLAAAVLTNPPQTAAAFLSVHNAGLPITDAAGRVALITRATACSQSLSTLSTCLTTLADDLNPITPTTDKLWIIGIGDPQASGWKPAQAAFFTDVAYWKTLIPHDYEFYVKGSLEYARFQKYAEHDADLIFMDHTSGKVLRVMEVPAAPDRAAITKAVKELTQ